MDTVTGEGWVVWGPEGQEDLVKMLIAYKKHLVRAQRQTRF